MCSHNSVCEGIGSGSERVRLALGVDGSREDRDGTSRRSREVATRSMERYAGFFALVAKIYVQTLEVLERQQAALAEGDDDDEEGDEEEGEDGEFTEADVEEEVGEAGEDDVLDDA